MAESHGTRKFKGGGELAPHPETAAQTHGRRQPLRQACEYWQCVDFATAESHGTREFIGGGELVPHPETAAQTHGWRQPIEIQKIWPRLNYHVTLAGSTRFPFVSSRNLKFARGPAVDKFFIREIVKIAIRALNPATPELLIL